MRSIGNSKGRGRLLGFRLAATIGVLVIAKGVIELL